MLNLKKKLLVIVDMQNDFIRGVLPAEGGDKLGDKINTFARKFNGDILITHDIHKEEEYFKTLEGKKLPPHCLSGTWGVQIIDELKDVERNLKTFWFYKDAYCKNSLLTFLAYEFLAYEINRKYLDEIIKYNGYDNYNKDIIAQIYDEIILCGVFTDVSVISNAILFKSIDKNMKVSVVANLCAGTSKANHNKALSLMKDSLQINIKKYGNSKKED